MTFLFLFLNVREIIESGVRANMSENVGSINIARQICRSPDGCIAFKLDQVAENREFFSPLCPRSGLIAVMEQKPSLTEHFGIPGMTPSPRWQPNRKVAP